MFLIQNDSYCIKNILVQAYFGYQNYKCKVDSTIPCPLYAEKSYLKYRLRINIHFLMHKLIQEPLKMALTQKRLKIIQKANHNTERAVESHYLSKPLIKRSLLLNANDYV